jgi:hypothetical protein
MLCASIVHWKGKVFLPKKDAAAVVLAVDSDFPDGGTPRPGIAPYAVERNEQRSTPPAGRPLSHQRIPAPRLLNMQGLLACGIR